MSTTGLLMGWAFLSVPFIVFLVLYALSSRKRIQAGEKQVEEFRELAFKDPLTGLLSRRPFEEQMGKFFHELRVSTTAGQDRRSKKSPDVETLTVVAVDVDGFKGTNDRFGHSCGDELLRRLSRILLKSVRDVDLVCRWGGDEILIALPDTSMESALVLVERIRATVENEVVFWQGRRLPPLTISAGVAEFDRDGNPGELVGKADKALYRAKEGGKNRVEAVRSHKVRLHA